MRQLRSTAQLIVLAALGTALAGCFTAATEPSPSPAPIPPTVQEPVRNRIVFTALQMVGVPYRYGGSDPSGFDCSGLVQYAYKSAGVTVPRTSRAQLDASTSIPLWEASPGDLLFFKSKDWSHVGIYLGEGRFVHAPTTGRKVSLGTMENAWFKRNFVRAGRMGALGGS